MEDNSIVPDFIKVAAVVTAMPRWVLALLAADGFAVPVSWVWVHAVSAVFGAAMTILEGIAVAYILGAMVRAQGKQAAWLGSLTLGTCIAFVGVLAPSIYSRVTGVSVGTILSSPAIWGWSVCVASSTMLTVAAVGYAQAILSGNAQWSFVASQWQSKAQELETKLQETQFVVEQKNSEMTSLNSELVEAKLQLAQPTMPQLPKPANDKKPNRSQYYDKVLEIVRVNPSITVKALAESVQVSRPTMYNILSDLEVAGRLRINGHKEVVEIGDKS